MKDPKQQSYWQETGRWAGYEESYDPQAGVWSSLSISYLTFKSLIHLRRTMNTGQRKANGTCGIQTKAICLLNNKVIVSGSNSDADFRHFTSTTWNVAAGKGVARFDNALLIIFRN